MQTKKFDTEKYPLQDETGKIIGICMEVHRLLGKHLSEIVYKDALEYEFQLNSILYQREKEFPVVYKNRVLPHKFYADFVVFESIVLEIKCIRSLATEHYNQIINYLAISKCPIGLLINFGESSLNFKRVIL